VVGQDVAGTDNHWEIAKRTIGTICSDPLEQEF
jgi:hypothetical protein